MTINLKKTYLSLLICLMSSLVLQSQTEDINGDGTLNILVIGTSNSIENNFEEFSPNLISTELQSICIQHEIDHLNGILFVDYLSPLKRQRIKTKLEKEEKLDRDNA